MTFRRRNTQISYSKIESKSKIQPKPNTISIFFSSTQNIWLFCLIFRSINSLLIQTYFNPDEHWQSLEVAHRVAFGFGHLTWEWKTGIRSYLHPMIFAFLYKVLGILQFDSPWVMARAPRLLQSVFASVGDLYLYKLSVLVFDNHVAQWTLFCQLSNWFMFYCITRTFSNSLETVLTIVGLYYWISYNGSTKKKSCFSSRMLALFIAALACCIRPTSAISWVYIGVMELFRADDLLRYIFLEVVPIGSLVLALTSILDRWMYNSWVFVPYNFVKFNFLSSGGDYYGTHPWHWYFTQGFTVMLFSFLPFSVLGIYKSKKWWLSGLIAWVLGIYSFLGHKEFRFVLPVLPVSLMFAGYSLAEMAKSNLSGTRRKKPRWPLKLQLTIFVLLLTNVTMALYMSLVHQRGSEDVMYYLAKDARNEKVESILFLMPCHATPYYSTLHSNLPMRFLDCSPSEVKGILNESDRFLMNPLNFASEILKELPLPSHIVLFDAEEGHLHELLESYSFKVVKRFFHAHFKVDRDLQASIAVYALGV